MKLYTEEQVLKIIFKTKQWITLSDDYLMATVTPIELPSDEEIEKHIEKTFYGEKKHYFKAGVEFMKEQILNQNK